MTAQNVLFVGGPGSGKSNYLFRTWIALERETGQLLKDGLPDDVGYLHDGASLLFDGCFAPHTSRDTQHTSNIPVKWRDQMMPSATLVMPDASGELWLGLYEKREWPKLWDDIVTPSTGIVLMVCAGSPHNERPLDWITCERIYGVRREQAPTGTPTQVMLVDWLQILHSIADRKINGRSRPRLSVVVSAWDRVPHEQRQRSPLEYLNSEFPLLSQFLEADRHGFAAKVFGLSILGGDLEVDVEFRRHVQLSDVADLGYVKESSVPGSESPDVLKPIYWALGRN